MKLFDLRLIIAFLFGLYGIVLTVVGLAFTTNEDVDKAAGVNVNLWAGLAMVALAVVFAAWAFLRPLAVPTDAGKRG
jgi:xanthine/uracil/vitamin C permease (AzgA family)